MDMKYISHFTLTLIKKMGDNDFYGYNIAILSVISKNQKGYISINYSAIIGQNDT